MVGIALLKRGPFMKANNKVLRFRVKSSDANKTVYLKSHSLLKGSF